MDQFEDTLSTIIDGKKIGIGNDCKDFVIETLKEVDPEISTEDVEFIFTVSCDESDLPAEIFEIAEKC